MTNPYGNWDDLGFAHGLYKVQRAERHVDKRGVIDTFWDDRMRDTLGPQAVEHKFSMSRKGTFRGMYAETHYKAWKVMTVFYGVVQFCFLDFNNVSRTFGKVVSLIVSERDCVSFLIAPHMANGHIALTDCGMMYSLAEPYNIRNQVSISYKSEEISTHLATDKIDPSLVSDRDLKSPTFKEWQLLISKP